MFLRLIYPAALSKRSGSRDTNFIILHNLRLAGLNLYQDFGYTLKVWSAISLSYLLGYLPLSFILNFIIYLEDFTPATLLLSLQLSLNTCCFAAKLLTLIIFIQRFEQANQCFDQLDAYSVRREEQFKIRQTVASCNKLYLLYVVVYFLYTVFSLITGLTHESAPFNTYYPFLNWRLSRVQLYVQAFVEFFTVGYSIGVATSTDSYAVTIMMTLRCHVQILTQRIRQLGKEFIEQPSEDYLKLVECIKAHKIMLDICNIVRPLISGTIFAQFIGCGSILGISMINLVCFAEPSARFGIIIYMLAVLMQTFPLCYYCTAIIDDCNNLADGLFHSDWFKQNQRYQKTTLYFLQKLQQPMIFNALNIFDINLATNINVAKVAFTIYAIAKGMNLDEKLQQKRII